MAAFEPGGGVIFEPPPMRVRMVRGKDADTRALKIDGPRVPVAPTSATRGEDMVRSERKKRWRKREYKGKRGLSGGNELGRIALLYGELDKGTQLASSMTELPIILTFRGVAIMDLYKAAALYSGSPRFFDL